MFFENVWFAQIEIHEPFRGEAALRSPAACVHLLKRCADRMIDISGQLKLRIPPRTDWGVIGGVFLITILF